VSGLAIKSLILSHFRSHLAAKIDFSHGPVALFGGNGVGKTNILEAISLLSPGRGLRRSALDEMARKPESLGWKISANLQGLSQKHVIETWYQVGSSRQVRLDEKVVTQSSLARVARVVWLVPAMDRLWIESAEGRRRFLDRLTLSFLPDHAVAVLAYEKAMRDRNRLLKDQAQDAHWYGVLEQKMASSGQIIMQNRRQTLERLQAAQAETQTAFHAALITLKTTDAAQIISDSDFVLALADGRKRDLAAGRTLSGPHRIDMEALYQEKSMPADQCSTGEQKALLVSLVLANARALLADIGMAPILLLDEVAAHLDKDRRAAFYDELCALGSQAMMTGTGPELFDELKGRAQMMLIGDKQGVSTIETLPN
jgi:DNA replication and repair protein RecF